MKLLPENTKINKPWWKFGDTRRVLLSILTVTLKFITSSFVIQIEFTSILCWILALKSNTYIIKNKFSNN